MSLQEKYVLKKLQEKQKAIRRNRDKLVDEKSNLKETLDNKIKARRKSKDGW